VVSATLRGARRPTATNAAAAGQQRIRSAQALHVYGGLRAARAARRRPHPLSTLGIC
jgi:hypothetical protein